MEKANAPKVAIIVAFFLACTKVAFGFLVNSMAIVSSAADSILDVISSSINYIAIKKAEEPPDEKHPYGHAKFESLATYIQSLIILISGGFILYKSIIKIIHKQAITDLNTGIYIMLLSLITTFFLVSYLTRVAKKTKSSIIEADALHYKVDILSNAGILVALIIIKFTNFQIIDPILSMLVAFYIIYSAIKLNIKVSMDLLDAEIPPEIKEDILNILKEFDEYHLDTHKIRTRKAGNKKFLDMHITLCRNLKLEDAHKITQLIENRLKENIEDLDVTIHMDPCDVKNCPGFDACNNHKIRLDKI
ncbi:cation efflux protein [Deferribacter desulfuricans SSM1]|uniref:Cation efflux protein n=1 Tax=Deferribacter desulfuricans (strain DSM 14783 / JCM 11476 / NBRC 101012 / SSM1) TaxID=639282 RepID=D3P9Q3_DEFDS|nr:cation diffusion facilitator family transporter [Deferribacter desulfuricans]BAI81443.1 cation efflux protein [Deferribacter desulfuricans SSM1]